MNTIQSLNFPPNFFYQYMYSTEVRGGYRRVSGKERGGGGLESEYSCEEVSKGV